MLSVQRSPSKTAATAAAGKTLVTSSSQAQGDSKDVRGAAPQAAATDGEAPLRGFIATLKESFGFIETAQHDKEVFFHFRSAQLSFLQ